MTCMYIYGNRAFWKKKKKKKIVLCKATHCDIINRIGENNGIYSLLHNVKINRTIDYDDFLI